MTRRSSRASGGNKNEKPGDRPADVRELFHRADGDATPDISRLLLRSEALVRQAGSGGAGDSTDPIAELVPVARGLIPKFALGVAIVVVVSAGLSRVGGPSVPAKAGGQELETLILGGETSGQSSDLLFEAIVGVEEGDG